jgi:subtilisin-like proprotein convertase family protein
VVAVTRLCLASVLAGALFVATPAHAQTTKNTFTNSTVNIIPSSGSVGQATNYPSNIAVSGIPLGHVYHVSVTVTATHTRPDDLDVLLVSPLGRAVMLFSDVGGVTDWWSFRFEIDDCAPRTGTSGAFPPGRYRPKNHAPADAPFPAPAPAAPYDSTLSAFNGTQPNGTWSLYVIDDNPGSDGGQIESWSLTLFSASPDVPLVGSVGGRESISCSTPDYDGDGHTDVAVYRETTGQWLISPSGTTSGLIQANWGAPSDLGLGDIPVPADYDADGVTDLAVYRQSSGEWFIRRSSDLTLLYIAFGSPSSSGLGDRPVPGDYDADGEWDAAIFRSSTGEWFIRASSGIPMPKAQWGTPLAGDRPAR